MSHFLENLWLVLTPNALNNMLFSQHRENSLGQQCSSEVLGISFFFFLWLRVSEGLVTLLSGQNSLDMKNISNFGLF